MHRRDLVPLSWISYLEERGLGLTMGVGRVGHGVGVETTEYPSLAAFEDITVPEGYGIRLQSELRQSIWAFMNAEDNWAITDGDPDLLTDPIAPMQIPIVQA